MVIQDRAKIQNPRKLDTDELELFIKCAKDLFANNQALAEHLGFQSRAAVEGPINKGGRGSAATIAAIRNFLSQHQNAA